MAWGLQTAGQAHVARTMQDLYAMKIALLSAHASPLAPLGGSVL
jgi:hypothetical protein